VPWVNGVKWRKANGLERLKPKDGRVRFNGAAMAGPPNQNPKGRRHFLGHFLVAFLLDLKLVKCFVLSSKSS